MSTSIFHVARQESLQQGWGYVLNGAILVALQRDSGLAGSVLAELGVTAESLTNRRVGAQDSASTERSSIGNDTEPIDAPEVVQLRARAEGLALGLGITDMSVALLLGLAYDRYGTHVPVLRRLGVERGAIVASLAARGVPVPSVPPPPSLPELTDSVVLSRKQAQVVIAELVQLAGTDPRRAFDANGGGRWAYAAVVGQPRMTRVLASSDLGLRTIVDDSLAVAGIARPPESAWAQ